MIGNTRDVEPDARSHRHLGQGHAQATFGHIVHTMQCAVVDEPSHQRGDTFVQREVDVTERSTAGTMLERPSRPGERHDARTEQDDAVTLAPTDTRWRAVEAIDEAEHADDRRRVDVVARGLVVEADVAADYGDAERATRLTHAVDGLAQLPHDRGMFGVAEVQTVDQRDRARADTSQIEHRFTDDSRRAAARIDRTPAMVAVGRERERATRVVTGGGVFEPQHRGVATRALDRVQEQHVVVLGENPCRVGEHRQQIGSRSRPAPVTTRRRCRSPARRPSDGRTTAQRRATTPRVCPRESARRTRRGCAAHLPR